MIIRGIAARSCPRALAPSASRPLRRFLSTEAESIDASAQNNLKPLQTLQAELSPQAPQPAPSLEPGSSNAASSSSTIGNVAEQYYLYKQQAKQMGKLGSDISPHYQPHTLLNHPPSPADVTLELLLASEAHQGHVTSLWNPANARYIHGIRQGIHIISLEVTAAHLRRAAKVVQEVARRGGMVLFVGTRDGQDRAVARAAELAKGYHLFERWIPGSITNGQQILGRCETKVVNEFDEPVAGFEEQLYDRPVLRPDLVVCMNPLENYVLLHECALNNIPTIGVIDTNADPTWVTYPIPANDDSLRCIQVIAGVLGRAGEAGQKQRLAAAARGEITYRPATDLVLPESEEVDSPEMESQPRSSRDDSPRKARNAAVDLTGESLGNVDEMATKLDEVNSHESHRTRGGRDIKVSS
ncbi:37S ribosomal protein MRP4, mitochondrial precursor [Cucurbitaria berberidis CBS 394.84]|uniref:37S ribosomal protein MRP4, mitochondrial n=1 Tax=Cucurbitaria berberidis CBS 394.84 TaxID=1168544 RepID=A0A9P4GDS9_9PLEO|nr:37S ribosomal protein MRP4, mitochondrial precursor [Cucurbitaria berberidis CBS 394.84]KAF1843767.1 37S ribosomal protein MRP4, mitochondrial precursor [Cucurbitaria berberidis CBS 394.84]